LSELSQPLLFRDRERICRGGRRHSELFRVDARSSEGKVSSRSLEGAAAPGRRRTAPERIQSRDRIWSEFVGKARTFIEEGANA
jgi:hypothetical protein